MTTYLNITTSIQLAYREQLIVLVRLWQIVQAIRENMKCCIIVVFVMENIFSYRPNLKIEIGGNGGHIKNGVRWISIKYFKQS